jgi:AcrR family transcriptional regulator
VARRARYHHGNLREALLAAALELVGERPLAELSLREVARRAGVSHAAPYRHFPDRAALVAAIAEHGFATLERELRDAPEPALAYLRFALERRPVFRLLFDPVTLATPAVRRALWRAVAPLRRRELTWPAVHGLAVLASERLLERERSTDELCAIAAALEP